MLLQAEHISKIYGSGENRVEALKDVSLTVDRGEMLAVMGKSGSGKSTLLHIVGGVDSPNEGSVIFDGECVNPSNEKALAAYRRRKAGFVFQDFKLLLELTVWDNLLLPLTLDRRKPEMEYAEHILSLLGLEEKRNKHPEELSGGQKQRVAIGRAIIHNPDIILCDEPTGQLDSDTEGEILEIFDKLHEQKKTIIIVTHDDKVANRCERTITLSDGKILEK